MRKSGGAMGALGLMLVTVIAGCSDDKDMGPGLPGDFDNPSGLNGTSGAGWGQLPDGSCANGEVHAKRVNPRVILVLDGSCSMSTNYPANGAMSATTCTNNPNGRWTALRNALVDPQRGVVPKLQGVVEFGLVVFGTQNRCPIPGEPVQPALNNLSTITDRLPNVQPGQYTPTGPALDWVYENMIEPTGPDGNEAPQIVILATDGEPNSCGGRGNQGGNVETNYQPSIDAVRKGTMLGATTYVISLADATGPFHDHLQELANLGNPGAGARAPLYEPASPQQLESNLQSLVGGAVGCEIELNGAVLASERCSGVVMLNGEALKCDDPNGWMLIDQRRIRLVGRACKTLTENKSASFSARFACTAFRPD